MLFGQSVFQSVLTRLKHERVDEEVEEPGANYRIQGLGLGFVTPMEEIPEASVHTEAYFAYMPELREAVLEPEPVVVEPEVEEPPARPVMPPHLLKLTSEEIAAELAITDKDTELTLAEKRRRFARANHPDGVPEEFRENATIRMQTANLMIDTAIKNLFWR